MIGTAYTDRNTRRRLCRRSNIIRPAVCDDRDQHRSPGRVAAAPFSGVVVIAMPWAEARPVYRDPDRERAFRAWQRAWRRRIAFSRRLERLEDGTVDPLAPSGRWAC